MRAFRGGGRRRRGAGWAALAAVSGLALLPGAAQAAPVSESAPAGQSAPRLLMAHYMPWFEAKPARPWGWHWTMGHYDPENVANGRRDAASFYYPLIGLYDSGDTDALQCQVLLMKLAGIDGVIIDWYGTDDLYDYASNNRNAQQLIPLLEKAGMRFAICYEDQTVAKAIEQKRLTADAAVAHGQSLMQWLQTNMFVSPAYLKIDKRPVLLSFGSPYYTDAQWNTIFSALPERPQYVTENDRREATASVGGFDWPIPNGGTQKAFQEQGAFYDRAKNKGWPLFIAAAFPRFHDSYERAGVGKSWGMIDDQDGRTYTETLTRALQSRAPIVQLVTWNDWGEGTQIEPSVEFGYRDLETTQRLRKQYLEPGFSHSAPELRLPVAWYLLRKKYAGDAAVQRKLDAFFPLVVAGQIKQARELLKGL